MTWNSFIYFALPALLLWLGGAWTAWKKRPIPTYLFTVAGLLVYFAFILGMWFSLERPPLRTMGETRLWYAFFLPTAGLIIYSRLFILVGAIPGYSLLVPCWQGCSPPSTW